MKRGEKKKKDGEKEIRKTRLTKGIITKKKH